MQVLIAACDYQLNITLASFSNPEGLCADRTCGLEPACPDNTCEYKISVCADRPVQTPVSKVRLAYKGECSAFNISMPRTNVKGLSPYLLFFKRGSIWVSILYVASYN